VIIEPVVYLVISLFPSKVIHIGGDEVGYDKWKESKTVQAFMNR
jgi:hexosaminidase